MKKKYLYLPGIVLSVALCLMAQGCKTKSNLMKGPYSDYLARARRLYHSSREAQPQGCLLTALSLMHL